MPIEGQEVKIRIDRKGRKGKSVTVVEGLSVNPAHLAEIAKELKQKLGTGGTAKEGRIEIQGEHREKIAEILQEKGIKSKFSGGSSFKQKKNGLQIKRHRAGNPTS